MDKKRLERAPNIGDRMSNVSQYHLKFQTRTVDAVWKKKKFYELLREFNRGT